jgi:hypothetical protein
MPANSKAARRQELGSMRIDTLRAVEATSTGHSDTIPVSISRTTTL